jgi:hypothetical protein
MLLVDECKSANALPDVLIKTPDKLAAGRRMASC